MEASQWTELGWLAVVLYLSMMIIVGCNASRRIKTSEDYLMAGRSLTVPINLIGATTITCDFIQPCMKAQMSNATQIRLIRIFMVGIGIMRLMHGALTC